MDLDLDMELPDHELMDVDVDGETMKLSELLESNFSLDMNFERELETNNEIFEKLIFEKDLENGSDKANGDVFNILKPSAAQEVLKAIKNLDQGTTAIPQLVQCQNCDELFTDDCFNQHVCQYNANKQLIPMEAVQDHTSENEFDVLCRSTMKLLAFNQTGIQKLLETLVPQTQPQPKDDKAKQSNHECFVCTRKFVHESGLYRHYDKHIGEILEKSLFQSEQLYSVILCSLCGECFTMEQDLWCHLQKTHMEVLDEDMMMKFAANELQFEMSEASNEPCTSAQAQKKDEKERKNQVMKVPVRDFPIEEFVRSIFVRNLFHCEFCSSTFANAKSLLYHTSKHEPSSFFQCNSCELTGLSFKDILLHRHDECVFLKDYRNTIKEIPCNWICNVCDDEFHGVEQLILHRHDAFHFFPRTEHKANQIFFVCELCSTSYETANILVAHLLEKHLKKPRVSSVPETSTRVQKSPSSNRKGGGHQTSTRPRQYLCEICGKSYTQSSHLWQHLRFHQGIKPFECPHEGCGRKFTIRPDLNDHIRKCHTGERPYECTICGKRFLTGSVYYQHRLIHRGERRYGCEECGKRFYRADALKNHQLIHSGEKPFECWVDGCHKTFRQRGDRDKHVKSRHKDAPPMPSPPRKRMKVQSFGRGRTKNNMSLYSAKPPSSFNFND